MRFKNIRVYAVIAVFAMLIALLPLSSLVLTQNRSSKAISTGLSREANAVVNSTPDLASQAVKISQPGEGSAFWMVGDLNNIKISGEQTNGAYSLIETSVLPQGGPPPHVHLREDEMFYMMAGEVTFWVGDRTVHATPGTSIFIPKGTVHNFKNQSTEPASMLTLFSPGGFEQYFAEVGTPARWGDTQAPPTTQAMIDRFRAAAPKYNIEFIEF